MSDNRNDDYQEREGIPEEGEEREEREEREAPASGRKASDRSGAGASAAGGSAAGEDPPPGRSMTFRSKLILVISLGLLTLAADQATKVWARNALLAPGEIQLTRDSGKKAVISVIGDRPGMEFRLSFNKGAAFGMFGETAGARIFLSLIGLLALGLVYYLLRRPESDSRLFVLALGFVSGGAVGNLVDRVLFGQVTDFIWVWVTPSLFGSRILWPWPAFNIADIGLVVGVLLMVPAMLFAARVREPDAGEGAPVGSRREPEPRGRDRGAIAQPGRGGGGKASGGRGGGGKASGGRGAGGKASGGKGAGGKGAGGKGAGGKKAGGKGAGGNKRGKRR